MSGSTHLRSATSLPLGLDRLNILLNQQNVTYAHAQIYKIRPLERAATPFHGSGAADCLSFVFSVYKVVSISPESTR